MTLPVFLLVAVLLGQLFGWPWAMGALVALVMYQRLMLFVQGQALKALSKAYAMKGRR